MLCRVNVIFNIIVDVQFIFRAEGIAVLKIALKLLVL